MRSTTPQAITYKQKSKKRQQICFSSFWFDNSLVLLSDFYPYFLLQVYLINLANYWRVVTEFLFYPQVKKDNLFSAVANTMQGLFIKEVISLLQIKFNFHVYDVT